MNVLEYAISFVLLNALWVVPLGVALIVSMRSLHQIGPTEVGLVNKLFSFKKLDSGSPIAFNGEAGYQAELLTPGLRWKTWPIYRVEKHPWVQVPPEQIGLVVAQVGDPIPVGAKSGVYKEVFGNFADLNAFIQNGGQKGVQRPVLPPGTIAPIHPIGFLVLTMEHMFGLPVADDWQGVDHAQFLRSIGLNPSDLRVTRIEPQHDEQSGKVVDVIGIVTTGEGGPLPSTDIAGRLGGFDDIEQAINKGMDQGQLVDMVLGNKNTLHNNYQDFQKFLDNGGCIGLQHDPLMYGAYNLNPFLVDVEIMRMTTIDQGQVGVVKAYVGLPTQDVSGEAFKFGVLVSPGRRGIWAEPLRTGKYPINPRCYQIEKVPTSILTLNWAEARSRAHDLDGHLSQIEAKSKEGFVFRLDLQVQIHVADKNAPRVISAVATMQNLVNEVLQAAVGNHFRDKLQSMEAVQFIERRGEVQQEAYELIRGKLDDYHVETPGVYIQDVVLPEELVKVLKEREIANQSIQTFEMKRQAEDKRTQTERARGLAEKQAALAASEVDIKIKENNASARKAEALGEASYVKEVGEAQAAPIRAEALARAEGIRAEGLARAEGYQKQVAALGQGPTALINAVSELSDIKTRFVPEILINGGGGSTADGLFAVLMRYLSLPGSTAADIETTAASAQVDDTTKANNTLLS